MEGPKLDPEFKKKWVEALRSGEYEQGKYMLYTGNNHYCCIGVAGCLLGVEYDADDDEINEDIVLDRILDDCPEFFCRSNIKALNVLAEMNDEEEKSFSEIADYIEKEL